jgi:peptidoglycan/LPS O-acetylase OafA/YrhL
MEPHGQSPWSSAKADKSLLNSQDKRLNMGDSSTRKYYPYVDALRGISILWVIAHHGVYFFRIHDWGFIPLRFAGLGFLGVDLFFVTSGFLITGLLMEEFLQGQLRIQRFYARRFFKIAPHYFLVIVVGLGFASFLIPNVSIKPIQVFSYLTLMQSYLKEQFFLFAHLWSISIEEHFYFTYPLFLFLLGKCAVTRDGKYKLVLLSLCLLIIGGNLSRFICFQNVHNQGVYYYQMTHLRFDALAFGCLLCFTEKMFGNRRFYGGVFAMLTILILFAFFINFQHTIWYYPTLAYLGAGFVLAAALCGFKPVLDLGRIGFLRWIGKSSYGIYLWHYILIFHIMRVFDSDKNDWKIMTLYVILSISCGALSTLTFEKFFLKLRQQWVP